MTRGTEVDTPRREVSSGETEPQSGQWNRELEARLRFGRIVPVWFRMNNPFGKQIVDASMNGH
jgi:hypothetical protein